MKEVDKEKDVTASLSLAILSRVNDLFYTPLYACLLSDWHNDIYMFVKRTESNLIHIKWNTCIMLRRHLFFFWEDSLVDFMKKHQSDIPVFVQNIRGEKK